MGAVVAREGGLISAKLASRISIVGSILGELVDPRELNAGEAYMLREYYTDREIREIELEIKSIENRLLPIEKALGIYGEIVSKEEEASCNNHKGW